MKNSVQFSHSVVSDSLRPHELQHARPPCPSPTPRVHKNPCPLSRWCHPTISSSVVPFSYCLQSFPASRSFQMSQLFVSGGQNIGAPASTSILPMNTQGWSPTEWTGWISLQSKGLSRVLSNATVQKHQFFGAQLSFFIVHLFPGGPDGKVSACIAGDLGSIPGLGRSPGEGNGNPLQYSCLENSMDEGDWQAIVQWVAKSRTLLSNFTFTFTFTHIHTWPLEKP